MPRAGVWAWTFVGVVAALVVIVSALAAVVAAGIVVLGLMALIVLVATATVQGVVAQRDTISASVNDAAAEASASVNVDQATWTAVQDSVASMAPTVQQGFLTTIVSGIGSLVGIASGVILGALIMYYLLKDGTRLRRSLVDRVGPAARAEVDDSTGDACRILRSYGRGRTIMSASVAAVIGMTSILLGLPLVLTIIVVNFIVGLILAVPAAVSAADAFARLRRRGVLNEMADQAQPALRRALD